MEFKSSDAIMIKRNVRRMSIMEVFGGECA